MPQVVADPLGGLHLFWMQLNASQPILRSAIGATGDLWWSRLESQTKAWTTPQVIGAGLDLQWPGSVAQQRGGRRIGVLAVSRPRGLLGPLVFLGYNGNSWFHAPIAGTVGGIYPSVTIDSAGRAYAAFIKAVSDTIPDANSVFFSASSDGGKTWTRPHLVSRSGTREAAQVTILASGRQLHLIWAQNLSGGNSPEALRHVSSADGGATWSPPRDVRVEAGLTNMRAAFGHDGDIHVVFESWSSGMSGHLDHAIFDGRWSRPQHLFRSMNALDPALDLSPAGHPILIFTAIREPGDILVSMSTSYCGTRCESPRPTPFSTRSP